MSDFKQAIQWMKEGKKIKRSNYGEGAYKVMREDGFIGYQGSGSLPHFRIEDYEATDWEIYGDNSMTLEQKEAYDRGFESGRNWDKPDLKLKESLSDGIYASCGENICDEHLQVIEVNFIKEKVQNAERRLKEELIQENADFLGSVDEKIKKILQEEFGDKLLGGE